MRLGSCLLHSIHACTVLCDPFVCSTQKPLKRVLIEDIGGEQEPPTSSQTSSALEERLREKQIKTANSQSADISPRSNTTTSQSTAKVTEVETPCDIDENQQSNQAVAQPLVSELHEHSAPSSGIEIPAQSEGKRTRMEVLTETQSDSATRNGTTLAADVSERGGQHACNVVVPGVPDTSLQFRADWKRLRRDTNALTTYFKVRMYMYIYMYMYIVVTCCIPLSAMQQLLYIYIVP